MATLIPALGACVSHLCTTQRADKPTWEIIPDGSPKSVPHPLDQARRPTGACRRHSATQTHQRRARWQAPILIKLPGLREEAFTIANQLSHTHKEGRAWGDMAILCADWKTMGLCAYALHQRKLPFNVRKRTGEYNPAADAIQIMTMTVSKGLEFPVVALPGVGHMPAKGENEQEAARVLCGGDTGYAEIGNWGGEENSLESLFALKLKQTN